MAARSASDLEIFSATASLAAASAFLGGPLFTLAGLAAGHEGSLFGRIAGAGSLGALWFTFVIVPALLTLLLVGLPCLGRALLRADRPRAGRRAKGLLVLMVTGALLALAGQRASAALGALGLLTVMAAGLAGTTALLERHGRPLARLLLVAGSASLALLACYEFGLAGGADPSVALAPTFMVTAAFLLESGLVVCAAHGLGRRAAGWACPGCTAVLAAWYWATARDAYPGLLVSEPVATLAVSAAVAALAFYGLRSSDISPAP